MEALSFSIISSRPGNPCTTFRNSGSMAPFLNQGTITMPSFNPCVARRSMRFLNQSSVQGGGGISGMSTQLMPICLVRFISVSVGSAEMYMVSFGVSGPSCGMPLVSEAAFALAMPEAPASSALPDVASIWRRDRKLVLRVITFSPSGPAYAPVSWRQSLIARGSARKCSACFQRRLGGLWRGATTQGDGHHQQGRGNAHGGEGCIGDEMRQRVLRGLWMDHRQDEIAGEGDQDVVHADEPQRRPRRSQRPGAAE